MKTPEEMERVALWVYDHMSEETRRYFALFHIEGTPIPEIAKQYDTQENYVRFCLYQAENMLTEETHEVLVRFLAKTWKNVTTKMEEVREKTQHFADARIEEIASGVQPLMTNPSTPFLMETATKSAAGKIPFLLETTTSAVATATVAGRTLVSTVFALPALPFLWFMSMMLTGKAMGVALVKEAPTFYAKRWLVKHLFLSYCGIVAIPILLIFTLQYRYFWGFELISSFNTFWGTIIFLGLGVYIPWISIAYQKVQKNPSKSNLHFDQLNRFVSLGFGGSITLSLVFFLYFMKSSVPTIYASIHACQWNNAILNCSVTFATGLLLFLYNGVGCYLFGELLMHSKDEETSQSVPPSPHIAALKKFWIEARNELVYMWPFIIFTVGANVMHLLIYHTRVVIASLEIAAVIPWWLLVLQHNMRTPKNRMQIIMVTFLIMFVTMFLLRRFVYHPYDM